MAVLYLDKNLKDKWAKEYELAISDLSINQVVELPFEIIKIHFDSDKFGTNESVLARLKYYNGCPKICFE